MVSCSGTTLVTFVACLLSSVFLRADAMHDDEYPLFYNAVSYVSDDSSSLTSLRCRIGSSYECTYNTHAQLGPYLLEYATHESFDGAAIRDDPFEFVVQFTEIQAISRLQIYYFGMCGDGDFGKDHYADPSLFTFRFKNRMASMTWTTLPASNIHTYYESCPLAQDSVVVEVDLLHSGLNYHIAAFEIEGHVTNAKGCNYVDMDQILEDVKIYGWNGPPPTEAPTTFAPTTFCDWCEAVCGETTTKQGSDSGSSESCTVADGLTNAVVWGMLLLGFLLGGFGGGGASLYFTQDSALSQKSHLLGDEHFALA